MLPRADSPTSPETGKPEPEDPIRHTEARTPPVGSMQHRELVAEGEDLGVHGGTASEARTERGQQGNKQGTHRRGSLTTESVNLNDFSTDGLFSRHRVRMALRKRKSVAKSMRRAAVFAGGELGAAVGRLEKEARKIARKRGELQVNVRDRSVRLLQSAARSLDRLASQIKSSGKRVRRK